MNNTDMLQAEVARLLTGEGYEKVTNDKLQKLRIGRWNKIVRGDKEWSYEPKPHPDIIEGEDWISKRGRVYWTTSGIDKLRSILKK